MQENTELNTNQNLQTFLERLKILKCIATQKTKIKYFLMEKVT